MREIKFRGKSIDNGEWVHGCIVKEKWFWDSTQTRCYIVGEHCDMSQSKESDFGIRDSYEVLPETVGQFTGILDKNGVEIYEGDFVKLDVYRRFSDDEEVTSGMHDFSAINIVRFSGGEFYPIPDRTDCDDCFYSHATTNFEVIGNKYDNPNIDERIELCD